LLSCRYKKEVGELPEGGVPNHKEEYLIDWIPGQAGDDKGGGQA
jgi:hypothetical protein